MPLLTFIYNREHSGLTIPKGMLSAVHRVRAMTMSGAAVRIFPAERSYLEAPCPRSPCPYVARAASPGELNEALLVHVRWEHEGF